MTSRLVISEHYQLGGYDELHRGLSGQQYRWEDLRVPFTRDKQGQASKPDYDFTNMGLLFPQNNVTEIVYITLQAPHNIYNSELRPHIHYIQDSAAFPVFKMDYRIIENGDNDANKAFTTLTTSTHLYSWISGDLLQKVIFPSIDISYITSLSFIMDVKIYRDDDIVTGDVLAKEFDVHYQIDGWGSREEFTK